MLIVITPEIKVKQETEILCALLENGLENLHIRKPGSTREDLEEVLAMIPIEHKRKIVLHHHPQLASKYNIKGLHLPEQNRNRLTFEELKNHNTLLKKKGLTLSSSFHMAEEIEKFNSVFDYVFLSPVFKSISKPDYVPSSTLNVQSLGLTKTKVIGLGGITAQNIEQVKERGFDGVAVLGSIWQEPEQALEKFIEIKEKYNQFFNAEV